MRAGRHYAQFTLVRGTVRCGVMQNNTPVYCYDSVSGLLGNGKHCRLVNWEGSQSAEEGDRIGLLLDLAQGSMTVYKNDERLGVMLVARIHGEYCWGAVLSCEGARGAGTSTSSTRIESVPAPAYTPPTADDLARTLALQDKLTLRVTQRWVRNLHHDVEDVDFFIKRTDPDHLSRLMELWVQRQGGARSDYIFTYNGQMLAEDIIHTAAQLQMLSGDIIEVMAVDEGEYSPPMEIRWCKPSWLSS
jgi:hypothetical protein